MTVAGRGRLGDPWVPAVRWQHVPWAIRVESDPLLKPKLFPRIKQVQSHAIRQVDEAIVSHCEEDRVEELYAGDREEEWEPATNVAEPVGLWRMHRTLKDRVQRQEISTSSRNSDRE